MLSDIMEAAWLVSMLGNGGKRRGVVQASLISLTLYRTWSALWRLWHVLPASTGFFFFSYSHYLLKTKSGRKRARHLGTLAHCIHRTEETEKVREES